VSKFSQLRRTGRLPTGLSIGKIGKLALLRTTGNCMPLSENVPDVTAQLDQASRPSIRIIGSRSSCWQHEFRGCLKGSGDESHRDHKKFRLCLAGSFVKIPVGEILSRSPLFAQVDPVRLSRWARVAVIWEFVKGICPISPVATRDINRLLIVAEASGGRSCSDENCLRYPAGTGWPRRRTTR
jgi:hypothetical protein